MSHARRDEDVALFGDAAGTCPGRVIKTRPPTTRQDSRSQVASREHRRCLCPRRARRCRPGGCCAQPSTARVPRGAPSAGRGQWRSETNRRFPAVPQGKEVCHQGPAVQFYVRHKWGRRRLEHDHLRALLAFHFMNDKQFEHAPARAWPGPAQRAASRASSRNCLWQHGNDPPPDITTPTTK